MDTILFTKYKHVGMNVIYTMYIVYTIPFLKAIWYIPTYKYLFSCVTTQIRVNSLLVLHNAQSLISLLSNGIALQKKAIVCH
jgi:hypothetical protein